MRPLISVCIPAYNRAALLPGLLDSILNQDFADWECVIAEDGSREREEIRAVVERYAMQHPGKFHFHANATNLGYDGNFRNLVELAKGRYVFVMGNDDIVAAGALRAVADGIAKHGEVGAILRAYEFFTDDPAKPVQVNRYYPDERFFPAGRGAILACYRRFVSVSGVVLNRDAAHAAATSEWDGTLFYQQWLVGAILAKMPALYLPTILAHFRRGGTPEFGNAEAERGRFTPGVQPLDTHLKLIEGLFAIAEGVEKHTGLRGIAREIRADFGRYSYHTLVTFAHGPRRELWKAYRAYGKLGLNASPWFHAWALALGTVGPRALNGVIQGVRQKIGYTPNLTRSARGR
jgi:abequosyltransferase